MTTGIEFESLIIILLMKIQALNPLNSDFFGGYKPVDIGPLLILNGTMHEGQRCGVLVVGCVVTGAFVRPGPVSGK